MPGLTDLETRFFGYLQIADRTTVAIGDLVAALGITPAGELKLLSRLARRGLIARVRRGLYLVPTRLPVGGTWTPSKAVALTILMADQNARYQITGPTAFARYGWDEQVPNRLFVYNDKISGDRQVGAVSLTLIKVQGQRLGATDVIQTPEGIALVYSSKARALMDAVYEWSRFETLPRAYSWILSEIERDGRVASDLIAATIQFGNQGTLRRIGRLLESSRLVVEPLLRKLDKALRPSSSYIPWIPTRPKRGRIDNRWKIVVNDAE